jgi:hypothetical protein
MLYAGLIAGVRGLQIQFHDITTDTAQHMTNVPAYQYRIVWEKWTRLAE